MESSILVYSAVVIGVGAGPKGNRHNSMGTIQLDPILATLHEIGRHQLHDFDTRMQFDEDGRPWRKPPSLEDLDEYRERELLRKRLNAQLGDLVQSRPHYAELAREVVEAVKGLLACCDDVRGLPDKYRPVGQEAIRAELGGWIEQILGAANRLNVDAIQNGYARGPLGPVSQPPPVDLLTTEELAQLARVRPKTFVNRLSELRKGKGNHAPPPMATKQGGRRGSYRYSEIRPYLCTLWSDRTTLFPETYEDAKHLLETMLS